MTSTSFDQVDIRYEARAFAQFLTERMAAEKLDLDCTVFIGYSNSASLIAAQTLLHPDLVHPAVLLRTMPILDKAPAADLRRIRFLSVAGERDKTYGPFARGHLLGDEDVKVVSDWLKAANAVAGGAKQLPRARRGLVEGPGDGRPQHEADADDAAGEEQGSPAANLRRVSKTNPIRYVL